MKCSKCKYITFDYLDACPRCGKDMSAEKAKLNILTTIKPNPPSLLDSLIGDLDDSSVELAESIKEGTEDIKLKEEEGIYDDGSELNINIDEEPTLESGKDAELGSVDLGSSEEGGDQESVQKEESEKDSEEVALDLGDVELEIEFDEGEDSKK